MTPVPRFSYGSLYFDVFPKIGGGVPGVIAEARYLRDAALVAIAIDLVLKRNLK